MIDYLIRSGLCLTILLAAYHLFLEREKMYRFNRFFLLFSLGFGLLMPLITFELDAVPIQTMEFSQVGLPMKPVFQSEDFHVVSVTTAETNYSTALLYAYLIGACILFTRLMVNLLKIITMIRQNTRIASGKIVIVLISENVVPHSFLNYIFLNKDDYLNKEIEEQILIHEMAHVTQWHSIDILLAELLKIIFWFNPIFIGYKRALQLNHEFLADEKVISSYENILEYQSLLLRAAGLRTVSIASNFNYSLTKKRFIMMKKHTSRSIAMLKAAALIPLLAVLVVLLSNQTVAQKSTLPLPEAKTTDISKDGNISKEEYFKGATIWIKNKAGKYEQKKYDSMTSAEKAALPPVPAPRVPRKSPTLAILTSLKDNNLSKIIYVDDHRYITSSELDNYEPEDFVAYWISTYSIAPGSMGNPGVKPLLRKSASLLTNKYYQETVIQPRWAQGKVLTITDQHPKIEMYVGPPVYGVNGRPAPPVWKAP